MTAGDREEQQEYDGLLEGRTAEIVEALERLADAADEAGGGDALAVEELRTALRGMMAVLYEADLADMFEVLRPALRDVAAGLVDDARLAAVINDMSDAAGVAMAKHLSNERLEGALRACDDTEEIEGLLRLLAPKRRSELLLSTGLSKDVSLLHSLSFAEGTVGELMDFFHVCVDSGSTVAAVQAELRRRRTLPSQCDKLFVTKSDRLVGVIPLKRLLLHPPESKVRDVMVGERLHTLQSTDSVDDAVNLFERYDLVSVPVLNHFGEVMGRVTVDEILGHMRADSHADMMVSSGLREDEDLYASVPRKLQNRALWIFVNLVAAFLVSRVIGGFEDTIVEIVALASLMPIVASMAGNTGMQTATLVIRALALNQIGMRNWYVLLGSELALGLANGLLWGTLVGLFSLVFYGDLMLALVLACSMTAVFLIAGALGFLVPVTVQALRGDPALGTSVIVSVSLDCLGFLIFLSLAAAVLA